MSSNARRYAMGEDRSNAMKLDEDTSLPLRPRVCNIRADTDQYRVSVRRHAHDHGLSKHSSLESIGPNRRTYADSPNMEQRLGLVGDAKNRPTGRDHNAFDTDEEHGDVTTASGFSEVFINQKNTEPDGRPIPPSKPEHMRPREWPARQQSQMSHKYSRDVDYQGKLAFPNSYSDCDASSDSQDDVHRLVDTDSYQPLNPSQNAMLLEEMSRFEGMQDLSYEQNQREQTSLHGQRLNPKNHMRPRCLADVTIPASRREMCDHEVQTSVKDRGQRFARLQLSEKSTNIEKAAQVSVTPRLGKRAESYSEAPKLRIPSDPTQRQAVSYKEHSSPTQDDHHEQYLSFSTSSRSDSQCRDKEIRSVQSPSKLTTYTNPYSYTQPRTKAPMRSVKTFRSQELDYNVHELSTMAYQDLQSQAFECESTPQNCGSAEIEAMRAMEKLNYLNSLAGPQGSSQRQIILASLSFSEYRSMGDLLIAKLGEIAKFYAEARGHRRKVLGGLENEISIQAKICSNSTDGVHRDLRRLKKAGKGVVKGQS